MASGIKCNPDVAIAFDGLKMKKKFSSVVYKIADDEKSIGVDKTYDVETPGPATIYDPEHPGQANPEYDTLYEHLMAAAGDKKCRYASFDFHFLHKGSPKDKVVFIAWAPENAVIKQKMLYASSKDYIKKALQAENEIQATDADEISLAAFYDKIAKNLKD